MRGTSTLCVRGGMRGDMRVRHLSCGYCGECGSLVFLLGTGRAPARAWLPHCSLLCTLSYATLEPPYASHGNTLGFSADP